MNEPSGAASSPGFDGLLEHKEDVFRVCLGFCSSYEEAEDLAQDVYVKAYQNVGNLDRPELAKIWLLKIARNAGLDRRRVARRRAELLRTWARAEIRDGVRKAEPAPDADPRLARMKSAIRNLPARFREVFVMREYGHLTYEEIGRSLGIGTGTVMSRLARSRRKVAAAIEGDSR